MITPHAITGPHTAAPWHATLDLRFAERAGATLLAGRRHSGPLQVQKALYPEGRGICHVAVLHPPGGVAAGDQLSVDIVAGNRCHAVLTTPGATKWYRSQGLVAAQHLTFDLEGDAILEWLPRENIFFNDSKVSMSQTVHLSAAARFLGWEVLCFGRRASGERWTCGNLRLNTRVLREGRVLWAECGAIAADGGFAASPVGLAGFSVSGTFVAAGFAVDQDLLQRCRQTAGSQTGLRRGLTWLPGVLIARYLGDSTEQASAWFVELWSLLRPVLLQAAARPPRLWAC